MPTTPPPVAAEISIHALRVEGDRLLPVARENAFDISIHALRVEGDMSMPAVASKIACNFYPRPPGGGRPTTGRFPTEPRWNFYPRPPGGGRHRIRQDTETVRVFLSTPSGWRATALFEQCKVLVLRFLSTPSGWRATHRCGYPLLSFAFLSTPSGWRATPDTQNKRRHAKFLSTPSGWRATDVAIDNWHRARISIHALRVEGDGGYKSNLMGGNISIHALRVEGDRSSPRSARF